MVLPSKKVNKAEGNEMPVAGHWQSCLLFLFVFEGLFTIAENVRMAKKVQNPGPLAECLQATVGVVIKPN